MAFHQGESPDGMSPSDRFLRFIEIASLGAIQFIATAPLAARMAHAPLVATALCAFVLTLEQIFELRMMPLFYVTLAGVGMAWYSRSAFSHPWDPPKLFGRMLDGYKRLLAPDRWAGLRLVGGSLLFLGGIAFMLAIGTVLRHHIPISRPVAQFLAIPAFIGGFLAASGLSLSEKPELNP